MCLRNSETNSVCKALTQGARCDLDTGSVMCFWMAWGDAIDVLKVHGQLGLLIVWQSLETYSEMLQVIHRDFVPKQVEKSILEHAAVAVPERMSASTYCEFELKLSQGFAYSCATLPLEDDVGDRDMSRLQYTTKAAYPPQRPLRPQPTSHELNCMECVWL